MLKVAVVGATGYTGEELTRILLNHPKVEITSLTAKLDEEKKYSEIFPRFLDRCNLVCKNLDVAEVCSEADLIFLALPHGVSMRYVRRFLSEGKRVIDLSADYRLKDKGLYEKWYKIKHIDEDNLKNSIYGLPELYKDKIKRASLIANPGCYSTVALLCCLPSVSGNHFGLPEIIIDAKSGLTGAGRKAHIDLHFSEINENVKAYKVTFHQHTPEISQELSGISKQNIQPIFVPHIIPINRGILTTVYLQYKEKISQEYMQDLYKDFYKDSPFVKVLDKDKLPQIKDVVYTNYCHIGLRVDEERGLVIVVGVIDNLLKGASGQAVENMNIMYGFKQDEGLV